VHYGLMKTLPRISQSTTRVKPFICTMPMRLDDGWNQIQFNLSDFTRRAYGRSRHLPARPSHTNITWLFWMACINAAPISC